MEFRSGWNSSTEHYINEVSTIVLAALNPHVSFLYKQRILKVIASSLENKLIKY